MADAQIGPADRLGIHGIQVFNIRFSVGIGNIGGSAVEIINGINNFFMSSSLFCVLDSFK